MDISIKHRTAAIQKSIETGDRAPLAWFDSRRYVQHNLALGDGFGALLEFLDSLPPGSSRVEAVRTFEDGEISFAHLTYYLAPMGEVVGFEVHRWEDGHVVEHWDNLQPLPDTANAGGRTMTNGPVEAVDLERTEANKELVRQYVGQVLVAGDLTGLPRWVSDALVEHSPHRGDGAAALGGALAAQRESGSVRYRTLHRVLGEGSFVLAMCEGELDGAPAAFYDLYRVDEGLIVEHWDVVETIPERSAWANDNGKF